METETPDAASEAQATGLFQRPADQPEDDSSPAFAEQSADDSDEADGDSVDTVDFSAEELEKLRVLKRLGAGASDAELIARIRAEREAGGQDADRDGKRRKSKRKWFG